MKSSPNGVSPMMNDAFSATVVSHFGEQRAMPWQNCVDRLDVCVAAEHIRHSSRYGRFAAAQHG